MKVWLNEWSRDSFISELALGDADGGTPVVVLVDDTAPDSQESDIEPVPIPQLSVRYKWLFVTGSYYSKTEFDFEPTFGRTRVVDSAGNPVGDPILRYRALKLQASDTSGMLQAGSMCTPTSPSWAVTRKYAKLLIKYYEQRICLGHSVTSSSSNIDIEGPTIGIAGSVPIGRGFGMYATYAHGFMDADISDVAWPGTRIEFDADYDVAEAGFSYTHGMDQLMPHLPLSAATVYAGYRYQVISTDFQEQGFQDRSDVTRGFAVGVNLTF